MYPRVLDAKLSEDYEPIASKENVRISICSMYSAAMSLVGSSLCP